MCNFGVNYSFKMQGGLYSATRGRQAKVKDSVLLQTGHDQKC